MNSVDAKTVTEKLGCQPVFACAGDFGWVTRPRLWWLSVKWGDLTSDPSDGSALAWAKKDGFHRLQLNTFRKAVTDFCMGGYSFHADVAWAQTHAVRHYTSAH